MAVLGERVAYAEMKYNGTSGIVENAEQVALWKRGNDGLWIRDYKEEVGRNTTITNSGLSAQTLDP